MRVLHERCCGLDIHKKFVVACLLTTSPSGTAHKEVRTYSTMTNDLLALADWLRAEGCGPVVMESTGSYWRPVFNLLEGQCEVLVVNAYHVKAVPGRKTDVKDAEWLADLLCHGLLRASFIPAAPQRHLRDLTRYRIHLVDERARLTNRLQTVLEDANIKLAAVVTDVRGLSAREILQRLLDGETDARALAELARGKLRAKRDALAQAVVGRLEAHHVFLLREQLAHLEYLDAAITRVDAELAARLAAEHEAMVLLETIPGVARRTAEVLVAEIGTDLSRFPSAEHLASWAGMCPGNAESGGRRLSGRTRRGNPWLRRTLAEVANVAGRTKGTYLAAQFRRIAARRGKGRAVVAVGHSVLVAIYHMLTRGEPYRELGAQYFDEHERDHVQRRLVRRLERLGFAVTLEAIPATS
ncbi:MAG TPA: IS110 family transposase [Ktedonobacterales bacterium]|jgi:transposase|nr:IS110 family transposase [Ktedonobacterales bacterium]